MRATDPARGARKVWDARATRELCRDREFYVMEDLDRVRHDRKLCRPRQSWVCEGQERATDHAGPHD